MAVFCKKTFKRHLILSLVLGSSFGTPFSVDALAEDIQKTENNRFDMSADHFAYGDDGKSVTASGNVRILSAEGSIWADKVSYNAKDGNLVAEGNVVYVDANNITAFVDKIELTENMKKGVMHHIRLQIREGENAPILVAERAEHIDRENMSLINVAYSPCTLCANGTDDDLPWKIRASEVTYNDAKGYVTYNDAYLDVYGTPVMYVPWFRHPVREVAVNGLLPPTFGMSTSNGFKVSSAYYNRIAPNLDTTTRMTYMSKRGYLFGPEMRYQGTNLYTDLRAGVINDDKKDVVRSHINSKAEYVFDTGERLGLVGEISSDDAYIDDFFKRNDAYLTTELYYEKADENNYKALSATRYQDLVETSENSATIHTLPRFEYEHVYQVDGDSAKYWTTSADFTATNRNEGDTVQRLATEVSYRDTRFTNSGNRFAFEASLRGDIYNVNTDINSTAEDGFQSRFVPQVSLLWDRSFISPSGTHKMTPKAMFIAAPTGGNPDEIPNEDSLAYELDTNNLFDTNRFSGYDRVETGSRVIYGLDNHWGTAADIQYRVFLGQSIRLQSDRNFDNARGDDAKQSDIVGHLEASPSDLFSLRSTFRINQSDMQAKRMDNSFSIGHNTNNQSYFRATHTFVENGPEELHMRGRYAFNNRWAFEGETRKDLEDDGRTLMTEGAIVLTEQCYRLAFRAQRRGYETQDVPPSTDYTVNIELLTFGSE